LPGVKSRKMNVKFPADCSVQFLFIVYSLVYSDDIFEIAHEKTCAKNPRYK
jgi:hypothetical protein